jgi:transposase-like protein
MEYMGMNCKRCGSIDVCKSGLVKGKQRYLCKTCRMNFTDGDGREKHPQRVIRTAIELHIEGNGFRRISMLLKKILNVNVCYQLVIHWIKSAAKKIDLTRPGAGEQKNEVPIIELDELFNYIKKEKIKSEYGLLLIETGYVLLDLKSATPAKEL